MNTAQFTPAGTMTAEDLGRIHLIGVGGVGMSGLARLFLTRGLPVSGSELREWPSLAGLRALGGTIHSSHEASNLDGVDTVVYSSAIPQDHLELVEARRRGLRVLHRSEALAAAMTGRRTVAVAGTHGKTTTTSMVTMVLQQAGTDPSFVIGGEISEVGSGAHHGTGEYFVVEADESDRSFLIYRPYVSIVTNIEADHLNTYGDLASLEAAFADFARLTDPEGFIITCADDPGGRRLAETLRAEGRRVWTYGESPDADLRLSEMASSSQGVRYLAEIEGRSLGEIRLPVPGRHMGLNSAAAVLTAYLLELPVEAAEAALGAFPGVGAGSSARASPTACWSTTSTRTTRPRCRWPCRRCARWPARAGCSWSSSRTGCTAPATFRRRSPPPLPSPTSWCCWRCSARASCASRVRARSRCSRRCRCRPTGRSSSRRGTTCRPR